MKYIDEDDNLLIDMICESNEEVRNSLYEKYEPTVKYLVKKYELAIMKISFLIQFKKILVFMNHGLNRLMNQKMIYYKKLM